MATPTVANRSNSHRSLAKASRQFSPVFQSKSKPQFQVFPTGEAEYHWRIVANSRTISRHQNLNSALRKCTRLNKQHDRGKPDLFGIALSGFRDVNSYRAYYEGVENDSE